MSHDNFDAEDGDGDDEGDDDVKKMAIEDD